MSRPFPSCNKSAATTMLFFRFGIEPTTKSTLPDSIQTLGYPLAFAIIFCNNNRRQTYRLRRCTSWVRSSCAAARSLTLGDSAAFPVIDRPFPPFADLVSRP